MRPLVFLVADKDMEQMLQGFFEWDGWPAIVPCAPFELNVQQDIRVAHGQNDPGLYARADELLQPFRGKYQRVVVMVDAEWAGSPGASAIRERISQHIINAGWEPEDGLALVLDPEVDAWLWSHSPHVAELMGWGKAEKLRRALERQGYMKEGTMKPMRPKEAAEWALRQTKKPRSSALYKKIAKRVSIERCQDPALRDLRSALARWFPRQGP